MSSEPRNQEGLYPVSHQHLSNDGTLALLQNNSDTPEPVAHPAYGNMLATQYSGQLGVGYGPAECHQCFAQAPQNVPALHHQLESQTHSQDIVQHTMPMVSGYPLLNTLRQCYQDVNGESSSPSCVSPHYKSHVAIYTNENSAKQSTVNFGGLQRKYSNIISGGSNMNIKNRLPQKQNVSSDSSTVPLQGVGLNEVSQTLPLHDKPSVTVNRQHEDSSILYSCLVGGHPKIKPLAITDVQARRRSSLSEETKINTGLSDLSQAKSLLPGLNYVQTRPKSLPKDGTQNLNHSLAGTDKAFEEHGPYSTSSQQQNSSYLTTQPPLGEILTDGQILDYINKRLEQFRSSLSQKKQSSGYTFYKKNADFYPSGKDSTCQSTCMSTMPKPNIVPHPASTSGSDKGELEKQALSSGAVIEQPITVGQGHKEDDSNDGKVNAELLLKAREKDDCATSTSEKHSKGTQVSAVENCKDDQKNEFVENSASVDCYVPVKKHLNLMYESSNGKRYLNDDYENKKCDDDRQYSKCCENTFKDDLAILHYSLTALKELIASLENVATIAEMDLFSDLSDIIVKQYWNGEMDNVHLFASTEYPQIMLDVAATCTKNEDGSPVVLTALSGITLAKLTEKHPNLTLNCSSLQEGHKSDSKPLKYMPVQDNEAATGLKPTDVVRMENTQGLSEDLQTKSSLVLPENKTLELILPKESRDENLNKHKNAPQHSSGAIKEEPQEENVIALSKLKSPFSQIKILNVLSLSANPSEGQHNLAKFDTQFENVIKDTGCVHSQTDRRVILPDEEYDEQAPLSNTSNESEGLAPPEILKDPKYEDITDDENGPNENESVDSYSVTKRHKTNHKGSSSPMCFKDSWFDDISEDDNLQIEGINEERLLVTPASEADSKKSHSPHCVHVQALAEINTEAVADKVISKEEVAQRPERHNSTEICLSYVADTDDGTESHLCPKLESKRNLCLQTMHSEDLSNDDDLLFIPVTMSDLKFEPTDLGLNSSENNVQVNKTGKKQSQDDSPECSVLDGKTGNEQSQDDSPECSVLDDKIGNKQSQDDISPTYGMVHLSPSKSAPASASSHIEVFDTLDGFLRAKARQFRNGCKDQVLNNVMAAHFPSNSEVASGRSTAANERNSKVELRSRRDSSSCETDDSCDYLPSPERNYLTVSKQAWDKKTLSSKSMLSEKANSMAEKECEGAATNAQKKKNRIICTLKMGTYDLSGRRENLKQAIKVKTDSKQNQHMLKRRNSSLKESAVVHDSDTEDEDIQNPKKKAKKKGLTSSGSADHQCTPQNRNTETADRHCGSAKQKPQETSRSSEEPPVSKHHSNPNSTQLKEEMKDAYHCTSDCTTNGTPLVEAKAKTEPPRSKKRRRTISSNEVIEVHNSDSETESDQSIKKNAKRKRSSSSESEDIGDAPCTHCPQTVDIHCGSAKQKHQESRLSSEESPVPKSHSDINETNEKLDCESKAGCEHVQCKTKRQRMLYEPVIARLTFEVSHHCSDHLKLAKESNVCRQGQDGICVSKTPIATKRKSCSSCEQNVPQLDSNEKESILPTTEPADVSIQQKTKASENEDLVTVTKHSSTQEGPCTSKGSLSSTSRDLPKARKSFPSRGLSQSRENSASSRQHQFQCKQGLSAPKRPLVSSKLKRCNSYNGSSSSEHPPTSKDSPSSSVTKHTSARRQITSEWQESFFPTRRDRKSSLETEEDFRIGPTHVKNAPERQNCDSWREARPGPSFSDKAPRQRHKSHDSAAPLMKRSRDQFKLMKAIHRDTARDLRCPVGEGFKWSEKTATASKTASGAKRMKHRSSPRPDQ